MRSLLAAIVLCTICLSATPAQSQVGADHFSAWGRHDGRTSSQRHVVRRGVRRESHRSIAGNSAAQIMPHPAGCPRRAFCGCGASVRVFGSPVRNLYLAANWFRFPSASPGPGMVAVRRGHVMVIERMVGVNTAEVSDFNSGGGLSRLHVRPLAGFSIRNPRG